MADSRRDRLAAARLYLVCDASPGGRTLSEVLPAAIAGGVDVVQLREKRLPDEDLLAAARETVALCAQAGALSMVNDRPDIAAQAGADGAHVGQDDMPPDEVRAIVGHQMLIGLSTHAPSEIDAACVQDVDYIGVGPVHQTPTKPGRPAVGTELVAYAYAHAALPFFAIGGIDVVTAPAVIDAGASRICALRAIADAPDPRAAAAELRRELDRGVGAAVER